MEIPIQNNAVKIKYLSSNFEASCTICQKHFRSTSTLQAHCDNIRHHLKLKQCYQEKMAASKLLGREADVNTRSSNVDPSSLKDEALLHIDNDIKKSAFLLCKAGEGFLLSKETEEAKTCLIKAIELANDFLMRSKQATTGYNENNTKAGDKSSYNSSVDRDDGFSLDRQNVERRSRLKRQKMEQISKLCKSLQRGSADLFQTMVQCYEESFDIRLEDEGENKLNGDRKSVKKTEILLNRDLVLKELADTEKFYVESLEYVVKNILPVFENCESDVLREAYSGIFSNIKEIYEWHSRVFVDKIEDCLEDHELLGPTFKEHENELSDLYETYCQNKPHSDDLVVDLAVEIDQVYQKLDTNYTILDYLIKPVQRVMKYQLLLHSIMKYTKKMGGDTTSIQTAFDVMEIVPQKVNDKMHLAMIIGYPGNWQGQQLVFQDTLDVVVGRAKSKPKKYRIFVFEDVVLMTETVERIGRLPQYRCVYEGKTYRMGVTETVENHKLKFAIWFRKFKSSDIFVCTAENKQLKERWITTIRDVLNQHDDGLSTGKTVHSEPTSPAFWLGKSMRSQKSKTWSADQLVKQATIGHPREYAMSTKLKENIQKFLIEEIMLIEEDNVKDQNDNDDLFLEENGILEIKKNGRNERNDSVTSFGNDHLSENDAYDNEINDDVKDLYCNETNSNEQIYTNGLSSVEEEEHSNNNSYKKLRRSIDDSQSRTLRLMVNHETNEVEKLRWKRSSSLPINLETSAGFISYEENEKLSSTNSEVQLFEIILAEAQFILARIQTDETTRTEKATELYIKSLSLFFNVQEVKSLECMCNNREDLLHKCTVLYKELRSNESFGKRESEFENWQSFYGFDGLFKLLTGYADINSKDLSSSWCIVLYSLAVMSANIESQWEKARNVFRKLGEMYKQQGFLENSVESYIDAHYTELETGDIEAAAKDLADALKVALLSGDWLRCKKLETMTMPLTKSSRDESSDLHTENLGILAEMSCARRGHNYDWFSKNYERICTCKDNCLETQNSELNELFMHLLDDLIKKKQRKSGEVFV